MLHLTRWRVVATTAATAVIAGGAFGLTASLAGPEAPPAPIELTTPDLGPPTADDELPIASALSTDSAEEPEDTVDEAPNDDETSIVRPESPVSQGSTEPTTEPATPTPAPAPQESPGSADSPDSVDSDDSVDS